jgi:hypothetical protein
VPGEAINDPVFGELTRTRGEGLLGEVSLTPKHTVGVMIDREDPEDAPLSGAALAVCREAYRRVRDNESGCRLALAALVLRDGFRNAGEETEDGFARKLELYCVHLFPGGRVTLWYVNPDDSLFPEDQVLMGFLDEAGAVVSWKLS